MGYNVETIDIDFVIPPKNLDACFEALKELNQHNELKSGGSWGGRPDGTYGQIGWHFSWMDEDYDKTARDAQHIFEMLGFGTEEDEGLRLTWYDSKQGDERRFLEAAAPIVRPGS
jgi:hypothetical protein